MGCLALATDLIVDANKKPWPRMGQGEEHLKVLQEMDQLPDETKSG